MKIYRTEADTRGWRTKITLRSDGVLDVILENNHKGYWREINIINGWCYLKDMQEALKQFGEKKDV